MSDLNREEDNFFFPRNQQIIQLILNQWLYKWKKESTSDWKCKKKNKQTNKQSNKQTRQDTHTNPRGELAGERLDEDFDFAVRSLSSVNSLATSTSW